MTTAVQGRDLHNLMSPRSVAVVGASARGGFGATALRNVRLLGFDGPLYAVNPHYDEIDGIPCRPHLAAIEEPIDAVAIAVPANLVESTLAEAADCGIDNAVVYASGLGEGTAGAGRESRLARFIAERGLNVIGPNCLGAINYAERSALWVNPIAAQRAGTPEGAALIAQSGNVALSIVTGVPALPLTHVISCGNQLDVTVADLIDYLVTCDQVKVIGVVLEGVPDVERLKSSLRIAAGLAKPVVALKVGLSDQGLQATIAHTGALSASGDSYRALFRQYDVVGVDSLDELIATCTVMSAPRRIRGNGIAVLANSGGESALVADTAAELGLVLPPVPAEVATDLKRILPEYASVLNPQDATAGVWGVEDAYAELLTTLARVPGADALVYVSNFPMSPPPDEAGWGVNLAGVARAAADVDVPVFGLSVLSTIDPTVAARLAAAGVIPLTGARTGLKALALAAAWSARLDRGTTAAAAFGSRPPERRSQALELISRSESILGESASKDLLRLYGIPTPRGVAAKSMKEAVDVAADIGFPVVMKLEVDGLHHKSDLGAVAIGIASADVVKTEFERLSDIAASLANHPAVAVRIEEYLPGDVELLLGVKRERDLGPVVVLGLGGVLVEVLNDTSRRLAPLQSSDVDEMVDELRGAQLLRGHRGGPGVDLDALAALVVSLGAMAVDLPEVYEVDLNPVVFSPARAAWVALDALVVSG